MMFFPSRQASPIPSCRAAATISRPSRALPKRWCLWIFLLKVGTFHVLCSVFGPNLILQTGTNSAVLHAPAAGTILSSWKLYYTLLNFPGRILIILSPILISAATCRSLRINPRTTRRRLQNFLSEGNLFKICFGSCENHFSLAKSCHTSILHSLNIRHNFENDMLHLHVLMRYCRHLGPGRPGPPYVVQHD